MLHTALDGALHGGPRAVDDHKASETPTVGAHEPMRGAPACGASTRFSKSGGHVHVLWHAYLRATFLSNCRDSCSPHANNCPRLFWLGAQQPQ